MWTIWGVVLGSEEEVKDKDGEKDGDTREEDDLQYFEPPGI